MNAAEALNEAKGPEAAYDYVNQVRARVGMPAYKGMTKEQLRERIRNERRIELAFEDHRFFDERRWKLFDGKSAATERVSHATSRFTTSIALLLLLMRARYILIAMIIPILPVRSLLLRIITSQCLTTLTRRILT